MARDAPKILIEADRGSVEGGGEEGREPDSRKKNQLHIHAALLDVLGMDDNRTLPTKSSKANRNSHVSNSGYQPMYKNINGGDQRRRIS